MTDHDTTTAKPERTWVWWCNEKSIAAGKISALAVVETFAAVGLWWWLAMHFNWSIFSFVALFAAPLLLLRSPESIQLGVAMLKRYIKHDKYDTSKTSNKTHFAILSLLMISGLTYWLASDWLSTLGTADLFWWVALLSIFVFLLALAFAGLGTAVVIARTNARILNARWFKVVNTVNTLVILPLVLLLVAVSISPIFALIIALLIALGKVAPYVLSFTLSFTAAAQDSFTDLVARANDDTNALESASGFEIVFVAVFFPVFFLGVVLRSQLIRLLATLLHLPQGLEQLPQNWRETLWVIDIRHSPELIPQAGAVNNLFSVKSLWQGILKEETVAERLTRAILLPILYLPALAYRWSLKASAWLWWPLFLLLKPPFAGLDERACCKETVLSVSGKWRLLLWIPVVLLAWLTISALPQLSLLLEIFPNEAATLGKLLATVQPPKFGLLYIMLWLLGGLTIWYYLASENLKLLHTDELKPKQFANLPAEEKTIFLASARHVEKLRLALIACVVIGGYAFAATWLHDKNPTYTNYFLAPWFLRIL